MEGWVGGWGAFFYLRPLCARSHTRAHTHTHTQTYAPTRARRASHDQEQIRSPLPGDARFLVHHRAESASGHLSRTRPTRILFVSQPNNLWHVLRAGSEVGRIDDACGVGPIHACDSRGVAAPVRCRAPAVIQVAVLVVTMVPRYWCHSSQGICRLDWPSWPPV